MILFPAIDILDGQVVRLQQGDYERATIYEQDPRTVIADFTAAGASWVHIVDLDGARGQAGVNDALIAELCQQSDIHIEVGGGVRSLERIEELAQCGVERIVLGTRLARDPKFAHQAAVNFGELLVAGVDARAGRVAVDGWQKDGGIDAFDLITQLKGWGYKHLVYTDIARDGMQTGIDPQLYQQVAQSAGLPVVVSGGIASVADLELACSLGSEVVEGVIVGRALYEGSFTLKEALAALKNEDVKPTSVQM